jgi:alkylation response protein AidB-like acyl-CoA dehydrogenase
VKEELAGYRETVRAWLEAHVPAGWEDRLNVATRDEYLAFQKDWLHTLRDGGYAAPHWPKEYGGGATLSEQVVLYEEMQAANAPDLYCHSVSLHHAASTIIACGTEAQKEHLPLILDGEIWCQGFSEPNAGSDLASLRTRAVRDGDRYIVNGQKIWSSFADIADRCLLLTRTDPDVPKRRGITYFLLDMRSPGIETRPIRQITDETEFCEVFFTDVEIPVSDRVGEEGEGWRIAQTTLTTERGPAVLELQSRLNDAVSRLIVLAQQRLVAPGVLAADDDEIRHELARAYGEGQILRSLCYKVITNLESRGGVGPEASIIKLYFSELLQRLTDFGTQLDGLGAQLDDGGGRKVRWANWLKDHMLSWSWTIAAGSNEIQRNLIAERVLGLPRDPLVS